MERPTEAGIVSTTQEFQSGLTPHRLYEAECVSLYICALRLRPSTGKSTKFCFFLTEMACSNQYQWHLLDDCLSKPFAFLAALRASTSNEGVQHSKENMLT